MRAVCECGCGTPAPIAKLTNRRWDHVKGRPVRFVSGHHGRRPPEDRCWEKVDQSGGPTACWPWTGGKNDGGYGVLRVGGRLVRAHRLAWELTHGPIPPETPFVLHNCPGGDNPACCNHAHLWLGTKADNTADMMAKGRGRYVSHYGPDNGRSKQ